MFETEWFILYHIHNLYTMTSWSLLTFSICKLYSLRKKEKKIGTKQRARNQCRVQSIRMVLMQISSYQLNHHGRRHFNSHCCLATCMQCKSNFGCIVHLVHVSSEHTKAKTKTEHFIASIQCAHGKIMNAWIHFRGCIENILMPENWSKTKYFIVLINFLNAREHSTHGNKLARRPSPVPHNICSSYHFYSFWSFHFKLTTSYMYYIIIICYASWILMTYFRKKNAAHGKFTRLYKQ